MKKTSVFIIALIVSVGTICGQTLEEIVAQIAEINEVQFMNVGYAGVFSDNYSNFEQLKEKADLQALIKLTNHENPVVGCYAGWGLIDKGYSDLGSIFSGFLNSGKRVTTFSGCIKSTSSLSDVFYHRFWNDTDDKETNTTLQKLDSLIIYHDKPCWLLLSRALENRVYEKSYNHRISTLAFDQGYREAIFYLSNWYKAEYKNELRKALIKYLKNTNFENVGTTPYYQTVEELLKFNEEEIREMVIKKLKKDRHWENAQERFKFLLDDYYIYQLDLEK
jgi:hypothetical protein